MLLASNLAYALLFASGGVGAQMPVTAPLLSAAVQISPASMQTTNATPFVEFQPVMEGGGDNAPTASDAQPTQAASDEPEEGSAQEPVDGGVIIVTAPDERPSDPAGAVNQEAFEISQEVDKAIIEPVVEVYEAVLPKPFRDGLNNFTKNLNEPINFVNFLLQLKIGKAVETLGRFVINTTVGAAGLFDVAKDKTFKLPYRRNGFANTLGYYGIGPGPYLFLPILGSTTVRDLIGDGLDGAFLPGLVGAPLNRPYVSVPVTGVRALNRRLEFDELAGTEVEDAIDPYATNRDIYLKRRQTEIDILRGRIADPLSTRAIDAE